MGIIILIYSKKSYVQQDFAENLANAFGQDWFL